MHCSYPRSFPLPHLQMVSLYQDPEGLTVFKGDSTAAATAKATADQSTIESLRRRIRELETVVSQNVRTSLYTSPIESGTVGTEVYVCLAVC